MALGANIWNMAFYGCFVGYYLIWRPIVRSHWFGQGRSAQRARIIAASIIGGVSVSGGKGTVFGAFLGVILMGIISNGMNILNINSYYQNIVLGIVIVVAVIVSNMNAIKSK